MEASVLLDDQRVWCDVTEFRILQPSESLTIDLLHKIVNLYRGPFLAGSTFPHLPEFERWILQERSLLERQYLSGLSFLIKHLTTRRDYPQAIHYAHTYLKVDDLAEDIHKWLIELYAVTGDRSHLGAALI